MNNVSVIIPSKSLSNFYQCASAIRRAEPDMRIILAADGLDNINLHQWPELKPCSYIYVPPPFVFAKSINRAIIALGVDDVVIMNDDALLQTCGGLTVLQRAVYANLDYGIIGAASNNVGNKNQYPKNQGLREDPVMVCFVCVFIPRHTIKLVGLLDEHFTGYGYDDDAYCLKVRWAGKKIGIHDGCVVDHKQLPSTFRSQKYPTAGFLHNREVFVQRYGADNLREIK